MGEPVAIKDPTAIAFRRQAGANALIVGQADEQSVAVVAAMMTSIAAQQSPAQASFVVFDGTASDSPLFGTLEKVRAALPHEIKMIDFRTTVDAIDELAQQVSSRQSSETAGPSIYVIVYGLQRYRAPAQAGR